MKRPLLLRQSITAFCLLVVGAAVTRLLPHPPNVTAIPAMALFAGARSPHRVLAFAVPLAAMVVSDAVLALTVYGARAFMMAPFVYGAVAATVWFGASFSRARTAFLVIGGGVFAALALFVISNFGVWCLSGLYPPTAAGLFACYVAALPFLANSLAAALGFGTLLFWLSDSVLAAHLRPVAVAERRP